MSLTSPRSIRIAEQAAAPAQTRARKQFNTLMKKLEAERLRLSVWHESLPQLRGLFGTEFVPLVHAYDAHRKQLVILFDQAHGRQGMRKRDKEKLEDLIGSIATELLENIADAELERIYDKYNENPFPDDPEGEAQAIKQVMADMFGVELDETVDASSPEAMLAALEEQLTKRADEQASAREREQGGGAARPARMSARAQREQDEAARLQQSMREIYRKLASDLHPDREPDPLERERKTALMQRVNVAYEGRDLLALLELQVEVAHIDQAGLDGLGEERVKQYNKILTGQLRDLEDETAQLEYGLMRELGLLTHQRLSPAQTLRALRQNIAEIRKNVAAIEDEVRELSDPVFLKTWLNTYEIPDRTRYPDDYWY
jgi:hypothetical protein